MLHQLDKKRRSLFNASVERLLLISAVERQLKRIQWIGNAIAKLWTGNKATAQRVAGVDDCTVLIDSNADVRVEQI